MGATQTKCYNAWVIYRSGYYTHRHVSRVSRGSQAGQPHHHSRANDANPRPENKRPTPLPNYKQRASGASSVRRVAGRSCSLAGAERTRCRLGYRHVTSPGMLTSSAPVGSGVQRLHVPRSGPLWPPINSAPPVGHHAAGAEAAILEGRVTQVSVKQCSIVILWQRKHTENKFSTLFCFFFCSVKNATILGVKMTPYMDILTSNFEVMTPSGYALHLKHQHLQHLPICKFCCTTNVRSCDVIKGHQNVFC